MFYSNPSEHIYICNLSDSAGEQEIPGLTDTTVPRRLGPKKASNIRKLFNLQKQDDVRQYVVRRPLPVKEGKMGSFDKSFGEQVLLFVVLLLYVSASMLPTLLNFFRADILHSSKCPNFETLHSCVQFFYGPCFRQYSPWPVIKTLTDHATASLFEAERESHMQA